MATSWLLNLNLIYETLLTGAGNGFLISMLEKFIWFPLTEFLTCSSKLDWSSYIISIARTASKKIGALICSVKFLSPEVALYLYKSTIWPCMEYCCHAWASVPSFYLEFLDKLQNGYLELLILHLLPLLNPWLIVEM